jgi:hypothetical protein
MSVLSVGFTLHAQEKRTFLVTRVDIEPVRTTEGWTLDRYPESVTTIESSTSLLTNEGSTASELTVVHAGKQQSYLLNGADCYWKGFRELNYTYVFPASIATNTSGWSVGDSLTGELGNFWYAKTVSGQETGVLTLPDKKTLNVFMTKTIERYSETNGAGTFNKTRMTTSFYRPGERLPVFERSTDSLKTEAGLRVLSFLLIEQSVTGIRTSNSANQPGILLNPVQNELWYRAGSDENGRIEILTATGQVLRRENRTALDTHLNVSGLKPGVYLFRLNMDQSTFTQKFIKL